MFIIYYFPQNPLVSMNENIIKFLVIISSIFDQNVAVYL